MYKKLFLAVGVLASAETVFAQTREGELQSMYIEYLREEGYFPQVDDDGDILFKASGDIYYIIVDADDLAFFQLYKQLNIGRFDLAVVRRAVNYTNRTTKVAKVFISSGEKTVGIKVDQMLGKPDDFKAIFKRLLSIMYTAEVNLNSQL
ncbi:MAG: hypothetical protein LBG27_11895 [Spirochaetaceae bacterium]|jgi:hypothetical protein|nr:hypothetical protein [Spirochaetaceae bacterium]